MVLITPETLNEWITHGYGTDIYGYNKIVIVDAANQNSYTDTGHVPGAYLLDSDTDLKAIRSDGVINIKSMVPTKDQMDALVQRTGIDQDTVVVITGDNMLSTGRTYFTFRYWGFPKKRLRVLNGSNTTYKEAGFNLEKTDPEEPLQSSYSICDFSRDTSVRASLGEIISIAEDAETETLILDARSQDEYNGIAGKTNADARFKVAFEGHIRSALTLNYSSLLVENSPTNPLLSQADILKKLSPLGIDNAKTVYTYCHTGWRASVIFLVLDALLGYNVKIYDGSWAEWGQLADKAKHGALKGDSPWRTDIPSRSEVITYNIDNGFAVQQPSDADSYAPHANLINEEDSTACATHSEG